MDGCVCVCLSPRQVDDVPAGKPRMFLITWESTADKGRKAGLGSLGSKGSSEAWFD